MAEERVERRLSAILAADIAGYSALMGADEARTVRDLKGHQAVVLPMVGEFGGRIINTAGDSILAEFPSVVNAVKCAVAIQSSIAERNAANEPERRMQFRIGVNIGDVISDEATIYGDGVNIAARLEGIAEPGGICISDDAFRQVRDKLDVYFQDAGEQQLKNIARPVRVYQLRPGMAAPAGKASSGGAKKPVGLWRYTSPYRGLAAMEEKDSDYFFGRERETVEVLNVLAAEVCRIPVLLGSSGVGKSSLAQAGVIAALRHQAWPKTARDVGPWPKIFENSRRWCFLTMRPGPQPIKAMVEAFFDHWQFAAGDPARIRRRNEWMELLLDGDKKTNLSDLLDATERRYKELSQSAPAAFILYVDQGEELYSPHTDEAQRCRFSQIVADGLTDRRLRALMSIRSDFLGALQADQKLFDARRQIDVPPLREAHLREVVSRPAAILSARFDPESLPADIARRAAEESTKDAGALPLLSYLLDDMWTEMVKRNDGTLRLPAVAIELGRILVERADTFLAHHPESERALRRLLTLKLASVREDGEPTQRRALRSEFTEEEWRLVSKLADYPNRLLVTAKSEAGETYAEVAHETIFRRWKRLYDWVAAEREFLAWRTGLEASRRAWQATPAHSKDGALLMGLALAQARKWRAERADDIPGSDREFIALSHRAVQRRKTRVRAVVGVLAASIVLGFVAYWNDQVLKRLYHWFAHVRGSVLTAQYERMLKPGDTFSECVKTDGDYSKYCPEMVVVPAGKFKMGSPATEEGRDNNEGPQHEVTLTRPFAVSKFEVTFDQWEACIQYGGCARAGSAFGSGKQPTINISWYDAQEYLKWLSSLTGQPYRLLTEAEWEYAARSGSTGPYSFEGDASALSEYAWYSDNSGGKTHSVGEKKPNAFGLYDMHGNIWEWVEDCYHGSYDGAPIDGSTWSTSDCNLRVGRSGSWISSPRGLRSADRLWVATDARFNYLGFRVGRTLTP